MNAILGKKIDQTQRFLENGKRVPVTQVFVGDNTVTQVKSQAVDRYIAVQLGFGVKKHPTKAALGHSKKAQLSTAPLLLREIRLSAEAVLPEIGDVVRVESVLKPGDIVKVTGTSKGKGFAGGVKRYGFRGGPRTHGQSDRERAPGSLGQTTTPGRVYKGKRMAGHMGVETVSINNVTVVSVDPVSKSILIDGLLPGSRNSLLLIEKIGEEKQFVPLLKTAEETAQEAALAQAVIVEESTVESSTPAEETTEEGAAEVTGENEAVTGAPVEENPAQPEEEGK